MKHVKITSGDNTAKQENPSTDAPAWEIVIWKHSSMKNQIKKVLFKIFESKQV